MVVYERIQYKALPENNFGVLARSGRLQEVVASRDSTVLLGMLYAKETGIISSDRLDLRLLCAFTFFYNMSTLPRMNSWWYKVNWLQIMSLGLKRLNVTFYLLSFSKRLKQCLCINSKSIVQFCYLRLFLSY